MKHGIHQTISLFAYFLLISTVRGLTVAPSQVSSSSQQPASLLAAAGSAASPEGSADAWLALLSEGGGKAAQAAYRGDARLGAVGLWTVVSAAVLFSFLACCGLLVWLREFGAAQGGQARPSEAKKSRPASYLCQPTPRSEPRSAAGSMNGSCSYLASSSRLSVSVLGAPSPRVPSQAGTPRLVPLCPQLVVPDSSKLQCMLPDSVCHQRQNLTARICSSAARGGVPLFQARVADGDSSGSGIHLETLRGEERMASVTTQMVWSCPPGREPEMEITTGSGAKYATMTKNDSGGYTIASGAGTLAVFAGQFATHDAQVVDAHGRTIAEVSPGGSQGSYEVVVFPKMDAGLIILGLLAIDKMESKAPSAR